MSTMPDHLKSKTLHGIFWSFFERIDQQGIQFVIFMSFACLLLPEELRLIAMLSIFMAVACGVAERVLTLPTYYVLDIYTVNKICDIILATSKEICYG